MQNFVQIAHFAIYLLFMVYTYNTNSDVIELFIYWYKDYLRPVYHTGPTYFVLTKLKQNQQA